MMKFFISVYIFFSVFSHAQEAKILTDFSISSQPYSHNVFAKSNLNIYYQLKFTKDIRSLQNARETLCILQIGDSYSKFCEMNTLKKDSLSEKFSRRETVGKIEMNKLLEYNSIFPIVILKSNIQGKIVYQNQVVRKYEYEEKQPELKWKIQNDSKKILNYNCKKAVTHYRGRDFIAWYTSEIPVNNGPYVFEGLPGIILEIEDSERKYEFVAVGIDKKPIDIYLRNENNILKVTREKFREIQKNYHDNPGAFHGKIYDSDGSQIKVRSKAIPYSPLELE
jgi:GLPGLI family protein